MLSEQPTFATIFSWIWPTPGRPPHYLNAALEDSEELFLVALRDVAESRQWPR